MFRVLIVSAALIGVAACVDQGPREAAAPCTGRVAFQVGTGTTPTITWQPACAVAQLSVTPASDSLGEYPLWIIGSATFGATIGPPIVYGRTPAGAGPTLVPADTLVVGQQYMIRVNTSMLIGVPATDSAVFTVRAPTP